jgi:hypothetical protein
MATIREVYPLAELSSPLDVEGIIASLLPSHPAMADQEIRLARQNIAGLISELYSRVERLEGLARHGGQGVPLPKMDYHPEAPR